MTTAQETKAEEVAQASYAALEPGGKHYAAYRGLLEALCADGLATIGVVVEPTEAVLICGTEAQIKSALDQASQEFADFAFRGVRGFNETRDALRPMVVPYVEQQLAERLGEGGPAI